VAPFRCVVRSFFIVRVGAPLEQEARELRMMRHAGRAVQRAFPLGLGPMIHLVPPRIRAGPGIEQRPRGPHEARRSGTVEPQVLRETQVGERIPAARAALHRGVPGVELEEPLYGGIVTEDRGRMDVAARDLRVRRQDRLGALEGPVPDGGLDERRPGIAHGYRNRRSSTSDMMNPNAGHPPECTERSNQARARALSPRTRYQLPTP